MQLRDNCFQSIKKLKYFTGASIIFARLSTLHLASTKPGSLAPLVKVTLPPFLVLAFKHAINITRGR